MSYFRPVHNTSLGMWSTILRTALVKQLLILFEHHLVLLHVEDLLLLQFGLMVLEVGLFLGQHHYLAGYAVFLLEGLTLQLFLAFFRFYVFLLFFQLLLLVVYLLQFLLHIPYLKPIHPQLLRLAILTTCHKLTQSYLVVRYF